MIGARKRKTIIQRCVLYSGILIVATALVFCAVFAFGKKKYNPNKYNDITLTAQGGTGLENSNLSQVMYAKNGDAVDITLKFTSGSTVGQSNTAEALPQYKVEFLASPLRLKITVSELGFWDYMISGMPDDGLGLIGGGFQVSPDEARKDAEFYFVLTQNVKFKVIEQTDSITVSMLPQKTEETEKWYLATDMFYEYQQGNMPQGDFSPMLCADKISVIMISNGYDSEEAATAEMDKLLTGNFEGAKIKIEKLIFGQLPGYGDNDDIEALLSESILSVDGAKNTLPLFFADARFLTWLPDNSAALFAKTEDGVERLYSADKTGVKHLITETGFATVVKAAYSADGKRLAFVEQAEDSEVLTVVDVATGKVSAVGNEQWGEVIIGIALNEDGTRLYVLSGDQIYSIKEYVFETEEINTVSSDILLEGELIYKEGYLYYCDVVDEYETVVRRNIEDNTVQAISRGNRFALSPDGKTAAVIVEDYSTAVNDLKVVDIESGSFETVMSDVVTEEFFFSAGGEGVFYIVETGDPEFYYQIMKYELDTEQSKVMAQCINSVFYASNKANEIIISSSYTGNGGTHPVTYIADFDKMITSSGDEFE